MKESLSSEQEAQAQKLAEHLAEASREDFLRIARTLVAAGPSPFGPTEFEVRKSAFRPSRDLSILILEPAPAN